MKSTDSRWLAKGKKATKHSMTRCFIALALTLVLTGLLAVNGASTSYAAGYQQATSGNALTQISSSGTPMSPKDACYAASIVLSDSGYTGNHTNVMDADWWCAASFGVSVNINFGDGTSASYLCWANCASGSTSWRHKFPAANRWYTVTAQLCWSGSCYDSSVDYIDDPQ